MSLGSSLQHLDVCLGANTPGEGWAGIPQGILDTDSIHGHQGSGMSQQGRQNHRAGVPLLCTPHHPARPGRISSPSSCAGDHHWSCHPPPPPAQGCSGPGLCWWPLGSQSIPSNCCRGSCGQPHYASFPQPCSTPRRRRAEPVLTAHTGNEGLAVPRQQRPRCPGRASIARRGARGAAARPPGRPSPACFSRGIVARLHFPHSAPL